ncbi:uncharacterized protein L969DRAFT_91741 [Mixia osmundae IAM 14324]|uniref:Uncharacterized protein n=1 Tax=Mixia osmundae (strain CBS 9802 / IAM 14324 / JCM 22182 / KY 12970) TaxID=764103 RepID=G7E0D4_MIXOS|nr:uncharacterized protein L969DRAFT_91741 [Mixia osmundae IAM 14324]KEI42286.1 hypothetical protein L969DRAFT_91741 [Mixia osmundae IAM 14324]GAA96294.1 hypothetical protein E5Q_02960 [Mixia osmundae IAM 14324]
MRNGVPLCLHYVSRSKGHKGLAIEELRIRITLNDASARISSDRARVCIVQFCLLLPERQTRLRAKAESMQTSEARQCDE